MKVHLVKDEGHKVVATFEPAQAGAPSLRPHLKPGHTIHEVEAEADYTRNLEAFYARHSR